MIIEFFQDFGDKTLTYLITYPFISVALFVCICFLIRKPLAFILITIASLLARWAGGHLDQDLVNHIKPPLQLLFLVIAILGSLEILEIDEPHDDVWETIAQSIFMISSFWIIYALLIPISEKLTKLENLLGRSLLFWLVKSLRVVIVLFALATVLEVWGIKVGPILAGMGLFGVAVALGAQDLFKNLISGLLILSERRMEQGDWIKVDGVVEGNVEKIGFRSTHIRRFDKGITLVPNTVLADKAVTNFSNMTYRRIYWTLGVDYKTSVAQLRQIRDNIETYLIENHHFVDPPETDRFVRIDQFNDSSIDIMVYCFTKTTDWGEWLQHKEQFAYKIKQIVADAGSDFAYPSQSVYMHLPDQPSQDQIPDILLPEKAPN